MRLLKIGQVPIESPRTVCRWAIDVWLKRFSSGRLYPMNLRGVVDKKTAPLRGRLVCLNVFDCYGLRDVIEEAVDGGVGLVVGLVGAVGD